MAGMITSIKFCLLFIVQMCCLTSLVNAEGIHRRFEYKYGFKPPYLAQKDGTVPFWEHKGNTIASPDNVRVTPSLKSQKGMIWNKNQVTFKWWEVEMWFRITGRGRIGADGLALWYTTDRMMEGPVFGAKDQWNGLGVFFDSFDNDNKRNNPYISGMVNDGSKVYDHERDGQGQILGGCLRDFRNKPHPVRVRLTYLNNVLTLEVHNGITASERDFELCFRAENVFLPENGYFGLSAATGGLADDHDVLKFLTTSLATSAQDIKDERISEQERQRLKKEFEDYQTKTEQAKKEYQQAHPDAKKDHDDDLDDEFDPETARELRQIFEGQSQIYDTVRDLHRKMDEIIGRQERTLSALSQQQVGQLAAGGQQQQPPAAAGQPADTIRRHEVDAVLNNQREIVQAAREIKSFVGEINQRSHTILQQQQSGAGSAQPQGGAGGAFEQQKIMNELRDGLNMVKRDMSITAQRLNQPPPVCPPPSGGCLSLGVGIAVGVIQLVVIVAYLTYRDSKQTAAKKFY